MILVGIRNDIGKTFEFPPVIADKSQLTLRHILNVPADTPNQSSFWPYSPQAQSMIEQIPEGGSWKSIPYENLSPRFKKIRDDMKRYHAPNFYRRFSLDEINGTITASAQPENCGITHPIENRRYTIREIARIQTFPDDYSIALSADGETWVEVASVTGDSEIKNEGRLFIFDAVKVRYVRIKVTKLSEEKDGNERRRLFSLDVLCGEKLVYFR